MSRPRSSRSSLPAVALALAVLTAPALARASPNMDQAEVAYRDGERDANSGDYVGAIDKWTQAYDLLATERNNQRTRHLRSIIAVNIATLQIGTYDRRIRPGDLESARKLLAGYLLQYEGALGKKAATDPDLIRVRRQLVEVESRIATGGSMAGPSVEAGEPEIGPSPDPDPDPEPYRPKRRVFRKSPWQRQDPVFLIEFDWDGPAMELPGKIAAGEDPITLEPITSEFDVERRRGWGTQMSFWTRPRLMLQVGYFRKIWRLKDSGDDDSFETRLNDLTVGISSDLLAIDRDWRVRPLLLPYVRGGYAFGQRDYFDPTTGTDETGQKMRGGVVQVGGHFGLYAPFDKVSLIVRGGVGKPWYFLSGDGESAGLDSEYLGALRWEVGIGFGFGLD